MLCMHYSSTLVSEGTSMRMAVTEVMGTRIDRLEQVLNAECAAISLGPWYTGTQSLVPRPLHPGLSGGSRRDGSRKRRV
jgi:hypothetical protein